MFAFVSIMTLSAQKVSVTMDYKSFTTPTNEPYIEVSTFVNGQSVKYLPTENGKFQAQVRVLVEARQTDTLINKLDYVLESEFFEDSVANTKPDFADVQNMQIGNGDYLIHFSVQDVNTGAPAVRYVDMAKVNYPADKVSISEISLYRNLNRDASQNLFTKYGFSMTPLFYSYLPETMFNLPFSCEIYNTNKVLPETDLLTVKSYITCFENNIMPYPEAMYTTTLKVKPVAVVMGEIGVFKLPSGNYYLIIDVFDSNNNLIAKNSTFFQRSNPKMQLDIKDIENTNVANTFVTQFTDSAKLLEYVRYLYPISMPLEKQFYTTRLHRISGDQLQKFFYAFWVKRNPTNPEKAWLDYYEQVKYVNREFGSKIIAGYRTDRGRVYLQYGAPNSIFESPYDSHSFPYEIWHYYYCVDQANVKFVFYNIDLVSNDFELLHSDKKGEMQDPFWQLRITNRKDPIYNFDERTPMDFFGGNPKDDWFNHR